MKNFKEIFSPLFLDHVDVDYYLSYSDDERQLFENLERAIHEREVIYYSVAMDYLSENDTSLMESMEIALEYGFNHDAINSETLATIHLQRQLLNELYGVQDELSQLFETETEEV